MLAAYQRVTAALTTWSAIDVLDVNCPSRPDQRTASDEIDI